MTNEPSSGTGQFYSKDGKLILEGKFPKAGVKDGMGLMFDPKSGAKVYKGQFKAGLKHGMGIEYDHMGNKKYKGDFEKDRKIGIGHDYDEDGNLIYKGNFIFLKLTSKNCKLG